VTIARRRGVEQVNDSIVVGLNSGVELNCEIIVLAMGVKPEVELAKQAELEIGTTGGIRVNEKLLTSDPDIYAIGDAVEVKDLSP